MRNDSCTRKLNGKEKVKKGALDCLNISLSKSIIEDEKKKKKIEFIYPEKCDMKSLIESTEEIIAKNE